MRDVVTLPADDLYHATLSALSVLLTARILEVAEELETSSVLAACPDGL